jgi:hypothetical protein
MATLGELGIKGTLSSVDNEEKEDKEVGLLTSVAAAIPSGVIKIAEGAATIGATLLDLGVDKNRAEAVEQFFADINPFDEAAEATTAGKIVELMVNIGLPGGFVFKAASGLTKAALAAKQAGTYLSTGEKVRRFGQGAVAGGLAEGVFVGNVKDAGTFGDFLGGPTELERDEENPGTELLNRLKFGVEGAAFTGAFGAAFKVASKLRKSSGTNKAVTGRTDFERSVNKGIDRLGGWFRSRGFNPQEGFDIKMKQTGRESADTLFAETAMRDIDKMTDRIVKNYRKVALDKVDSNVTKNEILEEMNDVLMSGSAQNGKLKPTFGTVDEFAIDPKTGVAGTTDQFKTGKKLYNVSFDPMDSNKVTALRNKLIDKYKTDPKDIENLLNTFTQARNKWANLFTNMGRRFTPEALETFEEIIPKYVNNVLDRGYNIFKNNKGSLDIAENYRPTKEIIKEAKQNFIKEAERKGLVLSDELADQFVYEVWKGASLPKGFLLGKGGPGQVRFKTIPDFMVKSIENTVTQDSLYRKKSFGYNMSDLTGYARPIVEKLLGKAKNPMSSILEGTNNLSVQVRSNQFFDDLIIKNNELKKNYDAWLDAGKVGAEPRIPFLYNSIGEAQKYAGGTADDFANIGKGEAFNIKIDKFVDSKGLLKNIDESKMIQNKAGEEVVDDILNPVAGKWALKDYVESFMKTKESSKSLPVQIYNNLVLYPKGMSQMAKTILAPFTHARNFISAASFAAANGILPFGNTKDVRAAWNALQVAGPGTRKSNEFYQELLDLGVVNSQVQLGDLRKLLEDVDFGSSLNKLNSDWGLNTLFKKLSSAKKFAQDAYTAEDDFWKIFTYLGEKSRIEQAYKKAGLQLGQEFIDPNGVKQIFNDEYLKRSAADLVKNNVPNYAFVSDFVKNLRILPIGNFVAFPAEILRTSTNIIETALKEINYSTVINGKTVNPLRARGLQRLTGMALTTAVIPAGLVSGMQALYDVSKDEIEAMRRYVPSWSKNSVLIPFKDENGNLEYIDFSHLNAYDTITRPIQTVINAVNEGRGDEDGLIDDFVLGLIESTKELSSPFISESIWTEALQDVFVRGGLDSEGRRIWNPRDSLGDKMYKSIGHLVEAQAPLNWKQLQRLGLSILPTDSTGRFTERGEEYEFGNEIAGVLGMRKIKVEPEKSLNYKINDYKDGIRDSRTLFTAATLKGGPVTPADVIDAYINANRSLYKVNRELYKDIEAAQILGMGPDAIQQKMKDRGENNAYKALSEGEFRPLTISKDVKNLFEIIAQQLGIVNPYESAKEVMDRIEEILKISSLKGDFFPEIENPFRGLPEITLGSVGNIPANVANSSGFIGQQNVNIPYTQLPTQDQKLNRIDAVDKLIR